MTSHISSAPSCHLHWAYPPFSAPQRQQLLRAYHEALIAGGVHNYSFELCKHDYKIQLWRSFIQVRGRTRQAHMVRPFSP